jgi:mono/diheme cytochrome c family protein
MVLWRLLSLTLLAALTSCAPNGLQASPNAADSAAEDAAGLVADGRQIAFKNCAECHAVDQGGKSPLSNAPPFQDLRRLYDPDRLAEHLIEGIRVGHDQMPIFDLDIRTTDALVAYIKSLDP